MPIPKEILAVERPKNTVVIAYGKNKDRYAVRQRIGCKYVNGRSVPVNGPTIGHIIDGRYVPIPPEDPMGGQMSQVTLKDWADIVLCDRLCQDIREDLLACFPSSTAMQIYCIAILHVCRPGIPGKLLQDAYEESFLSELYPGVSLSSSAVSDLYRSLGEDPAQMEAFLGDRASRAVSAGHPLLLGETRKMNIPVVQSALDLPRRPVPEHLLDISSIFAFDMVDREPVCIRSYPELVPDRDTYRQFADAYDLRSCAFVVEDGYRRVLSSGEGPDDPGLHHLQPLRRDPRIIEGYDLLTYSNVMKEDEDILTYKKAKRKGADIWYWSFRDSDRAWEDESEWTQRAAVHNSFDSRAFQEAQKYFGTQFVTGDLDMPAEIVHHAFNDKQAICRMMGRYDSIWELDGPEDLGAPAIGMGHLDHLTTIAACRLLHTFERTGLLRKKTYEKIMADLHRIQLIRLRKGDEWQFPWLYKEQESLLQTLDLLPKTEDAPKRGPGRPRKHPK